MNIVEVKNLSFAYKKNRPVLTDVSFSVKEKDILCLLGPNGSGKSTLLSQILFPDKNSKAHISLCGKPFDHLSLADRAKLVSFVPQKLPGLHISVLQAVIMGRTPYQKSFFLKPSEEDRRIACEILERLGLWEFAHRKLSTLSGGEIQRVFIAQALAKEAKIYFFDEPMAALDPEYQTNFLKLIRLLAENGAAVVFTTHNPNHLFALKGARVGMIGRDHRFMELDSTAEETMEKIRDIFNDTLRIRYSAELGCFVSVFND